MFMKELEKYNLERLREHLSGCTVLLRSNGDFPLETASKLALYGNGSRRTVKGGTGSGEVNSRFFVSVEEGLKEAGFELTGENWRDGYDEVVRGAKAAFVEDVKRRAKEAGQMPAMFAMGAVMPEPDYDLPLDGEGDTAVYVLARNSGEGNDRKVMKGDVLLTDSETRDILYCQEHYEKFLLVLNTGGPVDLSGLESVENILVLSQLGVETGSALADILLGKTSPSGKLTTTWAKAEDYCQVGSFGKMEDTEYREGIYVGYRYFDSFKKRPLFPFGYGLSYTTFEWKEEETVLDGEEVKVLVRVRNSGNRAGREVIQLYLSCPSGKLDKAYQDLVAFAKTKELQPGEEEVLTLSFPLSLDASYDEERACYLLEKGDYLLRMGNSSVNTKIIAKFTLEEDVLLRQVKNRCGKPAFRDLSSCRKEEKYEGKSFRVDPSAFKKEIVDYSDNPPIEKEVDRLSEDDLIYMNIGAFDPKSSPLSVIGDASFSVAGAAGESVMILKEKGIPSLVMSDGPAGLRLSPQYYTDEKGVHATGISVPESLTDYLPKVALLFMNRSSKLKRGVKLQEQYCTAIPIGTAIAQSFDHDFAKMCGDIVGGEMEEFGVDLWLAPALNIHRSILCGRNFEYYSEDPVLSGKMAAAVTLGVQAHPGKGTTIKHFAANNQETNRYFNNSVVSERALREIYLKGFELCIRESDPAALMTSYNLINGVHTSEDPQLCRDILRREFGYQGTVMTDWVVAAFSEKGQKYHSPDAANVARAGGDLFMPGNRKNFREMKEGLKDGRLHLRDLRENASYTLRVMKRLGKL